YMTGGEVVVLGKTGRNFAAGMSGGIAYVLDEDGDFSTKVNPTMTNQIEELDEADLLGLRNLVSEHLDRTGSAVAKRLLDDWSQSSGKFVKVFPADYKRVLAELEESKMDPVEVIGEPQVVTTAEKDA
ncbi:MAG: hypothetical protein WBW62_08450, partial [Solirubrobacterales bacterium]